jgi:hypothetical protein
MADSIADVVIQLQTDLADTQAQFEGVAGAAKGVGDAAESVVDQLSLFNEQMMVPYQDAAGQLSLFSEVLEPIPGALQSAADAEKEMAEGMEKLGDSTKGAGYEAEHAATLFEKLVHAVESMTGLSSHTAEEMTKIVTGMMGIELGVHALEHMLEVLKEVATEASEAAAHFERLSEAMTLLYGSAESASAALEETETAAMNLAVGIEPALNMAREMAVFGDKGGEEVTKAMTAAADAAAVTGKQFDQTSNAFMRVAETGMASGRILRQLGLQTRDLAAVMGVEVGKVQTAFRALDFDERAEILEEALEKFKGDAASVANDTIGTWTRFKNSWHALMVESGELVNSLITPLIPIGTFIVEETVAWLHAINNLLGAFDDAIKGLGILGENIKESVSDFFDHKSAVEKDEEAHRKATEAVDAHTAAEAKHQEQLEKAGVNYKRHVANIKESLADQKDAGKQEGEIDQARVKMGQMTNAQLTEAEQRRIRNQFTAEQDALNKRQALYNAIDKDKRKPEDQEAIDRERHKSFQDFSDAMLRSNLKAKEEEFKVTEGVNKASEKGAAEHQRALLAYDKAGLEGRYALHQIGAEEYYKGEHEMNRRARDLALQDAKDKRDLAYKASADHRQADIDFNKESQAARDKFRTSEQATDKKQLEQQLHDREASAQAVQRAEQEHATAQVAMAKTAREAAYREHGISAEQNAALAKAENLQQLQIAIKGFAEEKAARLAKGETATRVDDEIREKSLRAHDTWAKQNLAIDLELFKGQKAIATEQLSVAITRAEAEDAHEKSLMETKRAGYAQDLQQHRITAAEKEALDAELDKKEDEFARNAIQRKMIEIYLTEGIYGLTTEKFAKLQADLDGLKDKTAARDAAHAREAEANLERTLGLQGKMTEEVVNKSIEAAAAYSVLLGMQKQGKASVEDVDAAYRNMLKDAEATARAQGEAWVLSQNGAALQLKSLQDILLIRAKLAQQDWAEQIMWEGWGSLIRDLGQAYDQMWGKWASGLADAITQGKKFGDIMYGVLKQMEKEIISVMLKWAFEKGGAAIMKIILPSHAAGPKPETVMMQVAQKFEQSVTAFANAVARLTGGPQVGGGYTPVQGGGQAPTGEGATVVKQQTTATNRNTMATTAAIGASVAMVGGLIANVTGNKTLALVMEGLGTALSILTTVMLIKAGIPFLQEGGIVAATGAAVVHQGEVVANATLLNNIGRGGAAAMMEMGSRLSAGAKSGGGTVSFDGAVFHGVPDQNYVSQIMNSAVHQLRQSSRTWAFNPTGT